MTSRINPPLLTLLFCAIALHSALIQLNISYPQSILNADRVTHRLLNVERFSQRLQDGGVLNYLSRHGVFGDYAYTSVFYTLGGLTGVVVAQTLLALLSVFALVSIAKIATGSQRIALGAGFIYLLLPHSLAFPHVMSAEALLAPLIILGFYGLAKDWQRPSLQWVLFAGLMFGMAQTVRPNMLPWLAVVLLWLLLRRRSRPALCAFALAGLLPTILFYTMVLIHKGDFHSGHYSSGLGVNLHNRFQFTIAPLPKPEQLHLRQRYIPLAEAEAKQMSMGSYVRFVFDQPQLVLQHTLRDLMNFLPKSGITRVAVDLFPHFARQRERLFDPHSGWRRVMEQQGLRAAVQFVYQQAPLLVLLSACFSALFLGLLLLSALGVVALWRNLFKRQGQAHALLLLLGIFPLYIFFSGLVISAMQTRHRFPAEFAIALFASAGACLILQWWRQKGAQKAVRNEAKWAHS